MHGRRSRKRLEYLPWPETAIKNSKTPKKANIPEIPRRAPIFPLRGPIWDPVAGPLSMVSKKSTPCPLSGRTVKWKMIRLLFEVFVESGMYYMVMEECRGSA